MHNDQEFREHLLAMFKVEAEEHIQAISKNLIVMEKVPDALVMDELLEKTYRAVHSLKGASRAVEMSRVEDICQSYESLLYDLKNKVMPLTTDIFDLCHNLTNDLKIALSEKDQDIGEEKTDQEESFENTVQVTEKKALKEVEIGKTYETVRVSGDHLSALLLKAEELLSVKQISKQMVTDLTSGKRIFELWQREWSKVQATMKSLEEMDDLSNEVVRTKAFLAWNYEFIKDMELKYEQLGRMAIQENQDLETMLDDLLESSQEMMMFPFSTVLDVFPKVVRDLSKQCQKSVDIDIQGDEIELDKRILDEMKDPLTHMIRNCIDHGIEKPEDRIRLGKDETGKINIDVRMKDQNVEVVIKDDGAGIDVDKIKAKLSGRYDQEIIDQWDPESILDQIFVSGLSTSAMITELSGRGLGLAIVKEKVGKLGGKIHIRSTLGKGTVFTIELPLTIARFRGVHVKAGSHEFVVPTTNVDSVLRVRDRDINIVEGKENIQHKEGLIPIVPLADVFNCALKTRKEGSYTPVIVIDLDGERLAFYVDEVLSEEEVLFKKLGKQLKRVPNIAGVSILGIDTIVPIVNVHDLMVSAIKLVHKRKRKLDHKRLEDVHQELSVLVAEDSITSRTLIKNIMQASGYRVLTAVDGAEAYRLYKEENFDVVISDVEMPHMNGFELTQKIREEDKNALIPIVLITSLDSRQDKERGMEVGANAYIVKSNFDQSNLLDVMHRLIGKGKLNDKGINR